MPTYEALPRFIADLNRLTPEQRRRFLRTVPIFVEDLREGRFRTGLRVKRVRGTSGIYEISWSMGAGPPGRATWAYGPERRPGTPLVIWRRIGTHDILAGPRPAPGPAKAQQERRPPHEVVRARSRAAGGSLQRRFTQVRGTCPPFGPRTMSQSVPRRPHFV